MKKSRFEKIVVSWLFLLLFLIAATSAQAQGKVMVGGFEIDVKGKEPAIPQELEPRQEAKYKKWIVQFAGPIYQDEKTALTDLGASIGDYLPDFAFIVTMDNQTRNKVERLPFITGMVRHKPAYKIASGLKDEKGAVRLDKEKVRLQVRVDPSKVDLVRSYLLQGKGRVLEISGDVLKVEVAPSDIVGLAQIEEAAWIEEAEDLKVLNDTTTWVVQTNQNNDTSIWDKGLHGEGQVVGIGDTGLDYDMPWFRDPAGVPIGPDHRKILAYDTSYGDDYDADNPGHGTHVAGTLGGDRTPVDGLDSANGMAPKSRFYFQDLSPGSTVYVYPPSDLGQMFDGPYHSGARIHSNSWGGGTNFYNTLASTADRFLWEHRDFLALFANGNNGPLSNTVSPPATAKNVISVGATLNGSGAENIASFSSNGLTSDGRIKPTVCAPGDGESEGAGVISADSDGVKESNNSGTIALRGTSMATPAVAGAAALVRQYFMDGFYPGGETNPADGFNPSAALVKALLINGAQDMIGIYTDGSFPATGQGWGRVNLSNALAFKGDGKSLEVIDESASLATGQVWTRQIFSIDGPPLKITLVWTDYPGVPGAGKALVNDLDLSVSGPEGQVYLGNVFTNGQSVTGGDADRLNVEEQVMIPSPIGGIYQIEVAGFNVPNGPQPFALVISGATGITYKGIISLDRGNYNGDAPVRIRVLDGNLNQDPVLPEETAVMVVSDTEPAGESVILQETGPDTGVFTGTVALRLGAAVAGNGYLDIAGGDTITATYLDADDGMGNPSVVLASAGVDLDPPSIFAVAVETVGEVSARIAWQTDELADSVLNYGETAVTGTSESDSRLTLQHAINLHSLEEGVAYQFEVLSTDEAGNQSHDSNGGALYDFSTVNVPPSLTVSSSNGTYTDAETTVIYGTVEDPSGVASVTVNGIPATFMEIGSNYGIHGNLSAGAIGYELEVALAAGINTFAVVATDYKGNVREDTISVRRVVLHTVTASATDGGFIMYEGDKQYEQGTSPYYYIVPDTGYFIEDVLVDGNSVGAVTKYTFKAIDASHTIHAIFAAKPTWTISASFTGSGTVTPGGDTVVVDGNHQAFSFAPASSFRIGSVVVDGVNQGTPTSYTFTHVTANHTLVVNFVSDAYSITATAGSNGSISPAGITTVPSGGSQSYTFTPDPGYRVYNVIVNNLSKGALDSYTFTSVQANQAISVNFASMLNAVTATATVGGSISPAGIGQYGGGTSPTYYILPDAGYSIEDVLVDGNSVGAVTKYTFKAIDASHTIHAIFSAKPAWTISASFTGNGTVTPEGDTAVLEGASLTCSFAPAVGFRIGSVVVDGVSQGTPTSYAFTNVTANHALVVDFILSDTYSITATAGSNGAISPEGVTTVPGGGSQSYTFTPNPGYRVYNVIVNNLSKGALDSYTFTNVQTNQAITVTFAPILHTVTATATDGGSISPTGIGQYSGGTSPTYYILPDAGYSIQDVLVDGNSVGAVTKYTFKAIDASHTIHAIFSAKPAWTISASFTGNGTVTPEGDTAVLEGASLTCSFAPAAGFRIGSVVVDGVSQGTPTSYTFTNVTTNHAIVVNFISDTYSITATAGSNGNISPAGVTTVPGGGSQSYTFTPDPGYRVYNVIVNNLSKGALDSYTFTNVQTNQAITVTFAPMLHTVTATATDGGTISPAGISQYSEGTNPVYRIIPAAGYRIADVQVDGNSVGAVKKYTFTAINASHTISANFALRQ